MAFRPWHGGRHGLDRHALLWRRTGSDSTGWKRAHLARLTAGLGLTEVERLTSRRLRQLSRHRAKRGTHARYRAIEATLVTRRRKTPRDLRDIVRRRARRAA